MENSFRAIEEIAKFEQRNELRNGKFVTLFNTKAVSSLEKEEKEQFFNYLRNRKIKNRFFWVFLSSMLLFAIFANPQVTGNVIFNNNQTANVVSFTLIGLFIVSLIIIVFVQKRIKELDKKLAHHVELAEKVIK
jgi:Na+/melibiose symporter-like transporter